MALAKRVFLFIAVNALVLLTVSFVLNFFGIKPYLTAYGLDYQSLMVFCLIWGMAGAFISLGLSRVMAKFMMGVKIVDPQTSDPHLQDLVQTIHQLAQSAGLPKMPEVGIYDSPEVNAFATGPTKSRSLVAVSTGLLQRMNRDEVSGVLGHEVAHIANGDMVTMTLIQGVVNAFVMFLARAVAFAIMQATRGRDGEGSGMGHFAYFITVMVLEMFFMILGSIVVSWFSRFREYRADAGGARLAGRDQMIRALQALQKTIEISDPHQNQSKAFQSMKISTRSGGLMRLFSTHPPLEERIARLQSA